MSRSSAVRIQPQQQESWELRIIRSEQQQHSGPNQRLGEIEKFPSQELPAKEEASASSRYDSVRSHWGRVANRVMKQTGHEGEGWAAQFRLYARDAAQGKMNRVNLTQFPEDAVKRLQITMMQSNVHGF